HHQVLQTGQGLAGMDQVRVGHRRVFTLDVHALDLPGGDGVHDLHDGQPGGGIQTAAPELFVDLAHRLVLHRLVVGEDHGNEAGVGGTLNVVLAAQRVQAGAGTADLAGGERQRDQAARIVGAVDVLADPHAPEDDRALGAGVEARDLPNGGRGDAADLFHLLGREVLDADLELFEALGVGLDVLLVVELLLHDRVEHGI